jgi:hypothetical protein
MSTTFDPLLALLLELVVDELLLLLPHAAITSAPAPASSGPARALLGNLIVLLLPPGPSTTLV